MTKKMNSQEYSHLQKDLHNNTTSQHPTVVGKISQGLTPR